jgi:hypothetical protein
VYGPDEARAYRVFEDVPRNAEDVLRCAEDVLVPIPLPHPVFEYLLIVVTGELLRAGDESPAVGRWPRSGGEQVNVIGHEAVRNKAEVIVRGGSQDLRTREVDAISRGEEWTPPARAECEEISVFAKVVEAAQRLRMEWNHARANGNDRASSVGGNPAEAGLHESG